jgi:hypothetical protein
MPLNNLAGGPMRPPLNQAPATAGFGEGRITPQMSLPNSVVARLNPQLNRDPAVAGGGEVPSPVQPVRGTY